MKAICVGYLPILTRSLPSGRIVASTEGGRSITLPYDGSGGDARHAAACEALCAKLGWTEDMVGNSMPGDCTRYLWMRKP